MEIRLSPVAGCLVALIIAGACSCLLVPGARAQGTGAEEFNSLVSAPGGGTVHVDLPPPFVIPDSVADTTFLKGYYDKNGCPIGMTVGGKEAPHLRDPGFSSGAQCRGACGPDCPTGRCTQLPDIAIESRDKTGTCWYYGVISCPSDKGCQEHDSCYDWCESNGHTLMLDSCHLQCNDRCFEKYGYATCSKWADLPGRTGRYATKTIDSLLTPSYGASSLKFSYAPDFRENPITLAPTTVVQTTPTVVPATTPVPTTTATTVPTVPTVTTTATTSPASGNTVKLTLIWTGTSKGDAVNVEPQSSGSCDRSGGGFQCSGTFERGTKVTLTAIANEGSRFNGWFRGCSGTGACTLTMDRDKTVEAQFDLIPVTTVILNGEEYCAANYPGSVYDRDEQACVFHRGTVTPTTTYATSGGLVLIPLAGACCPDEYCETQIATASGGSPPYSFTSSSLAAGSAPPMGMTIDINGVLKGKAPSLKSPPRGDTYTLGVCVKDLSGQSTCGQSTMVVS
jgi:hypothetical protein